MAYTGIGGFPPQQDKGDVVKNITGACRLKSLDNSDNKNPHRNYSNHIYTVYFHINKINKYVYVGITHYNNPMRRWGYDGQHYRHCVKFMNAIKKYGWENFEHIILCRTNKQRAIVLERVWIAYYKRKGMCYNLADGGEGTECITENNRKALSERMRNNHPMKGKHHTPEARAKISAANRLREYTEEQKEQLRQVGKKGRETMRKRGWVHNSNGIEQMRKRFSKPVLQLDMEGNVIREFSSTAAADLYINNGKRHNHIADVCNGKRATCNGYKWIYKNKEE